MKSNSVATKLLARFIREDKDPIDSSMKLIGSVLQFVGIHNLFAEKKRCLTPFSILMILLNFCCFFYLGPLSQLLYLIHVYPDQGEIFKALDCLSATCIPLSIYVFLWIESSKGGLRNIFELSREGLVALTADETSKPLRVAIRRGSYVSWLVVANLGTVHIAYILVPIIFTVFGMRTIPTTPGGAFGLTPIEETPNFEITFFMTTFGTFFSAINQIGYNILFVTLLSHELGHYYSIIDTLNSLENYLKLSNTSSEIPDRDKHVEKTLKFCVKHHQFLIRYHTAVKEMFKGIFGMHYLIMVLILVTTLQTLKVWDIRNTLLTGATGIMPLIIYCFGGELVISAGLDLERSLHACGWQSMRWYHAKYVLFMLTAAQRPLQLTAADMFIMNRETFGDVVQVVYKVYAVFN